MDAVAFAETFDNESIPLLCCDPPFYGIVAEEWDNAWKNQIEFVDWLYLVFMAYLPKLTPDGSLVFFGGIGKHGCHPLFRLMSLLEGGGYTFRNWLTWKKRRAYGKSHDYLFCREEILWYSRSSERTEVRFNIPLLGEKRGYPGWDKNHPAKSEYKRVSNVWDDIPELMRPARSCEKPIPLMRRLVETHSNPGDLVVDPFCGCGTTAVAAIQADRRFSGCDQDADAVQITQSRLLGESKK